MLTGETFAYVLESVQTLGEVTEYESGLELARLAGAIELGSMTEPEITPVAVPGYCYVSGIAFDQPGFEAVLGSESGPALELELEIEIELELELELEIEPELEFEVELELELEIELELELELGIELELEIELEVELEVEPVFVLEAGTGLFGLLGVLAPVLVLKVVRTGEGNAVISTGCCYRR